MPKSKAQVMEALIQYREEWQVVANGESLLEVESPVGLILSDIADMLDLSPKERQAVLGRKLNRQVEEFENQPIPVKLPS